MLHNHAANSSRQPTYPQSSPSPSVESVATEPPTGNAFSRGAPTVNTSGLRDGSLARGRPLHGAHTTSTSARAGSAQPSASDTGYEKGLIGPGEGGLQRRTSNSYGHHRQTSVINGIQHSRNTSFNSPLTTSPLSPESLHNAGLRNAAAMRRAQGMGMGMGMESVSPQSSTLSPEMSHVQAPSIDSTLDFEFDTPHDISLTATRKTAGPSRTRRGHGPGASISAQIEQRTPGEFAMHHLFHSFVVRADQKISQCLSTLDVSSTPVELVCGKGVDPAFDQLISALGHVSRQQPKALVDSLMFWRQAKADAAIAFKKQLGPHRSQAGNTSLPTALPRRHTEPLHTMTDTPSPQAQVHSNHGTGDDIASEEYQNLDRQATVSIYILCRGLIEIFEQSSLAAITPELAFKLEDIVFTQLKSFEPQQAANASLRIANWKIYGQLLGQMSNLDFFRVVQRFLHQLGTWQQEIASGTGTTANARDLENRVELLLLSMKHLRLTLSPATIGQTCEFLLGLAQLFIDSHGPRVKQAYCQTFEDMLIQLAPEPERVQVVPRFRDFLDLINPRLNQMLTKLRHWSSALPLSTLLLCLAPQDTFMTQWIPTITSLAQKLKDRSSRTQAMRAISQLVWAFLHRSQESPTFKIRKVDEIVRIVLPAGKKPHLSTESSIAEATLYFIQVVGFAFPDLCFKNIIFPLVNSDIVQSTRELRIEQLEPEKVTIGIRSFLQLMSALEQGPPGRPKFPTFSTKIPNSEATSGSPIPLTLPLVPDLYQRVPIRDPEEVSSLPVHVQSLDDTSTAHYRHFCEILGKITILCDQAFGSSAVLNEKFSVLTPKTPLVDAFSLNKKDDGLALEQKQSYYDLLHVAIQALPRCFSDHISLPILTNLLCTGSAHVQPYIASAAARSLKAVARQGYAQSVAAAFPRFIFQYDSQYSTMSDEGRLGPAHIETTLTLYLELLQIWTEQIKVKAKASLSDSRDKSSTNVNRALQMEMTNVIPLVDEIEGYGLFFLCSQSRRVRGYAIKVLNLVLQFDEVLGKDEQSRVVKVLESKSAEILDIKTDILTVAERSRLQKDKRRTESQNILIEISSSEVTYDSTLWFKAFPNLMRFVFELCPSAIAYSRGIVCDRLALMQSDVERLAASFIGAQDFRLLGRSAATPIEVFFDQWKLYLIMACVTLSSPGAQSQSQLANAAHTRKTSKNVSNMQEKLSSARALFSAVIPMLGAGSEALRSAVVIALGSINRKLYRTLLESLQYAVITCNDEAKARIVSHQRTPSSPSRSQMTERMRTEVTYIYKLTSSFLRYDDVLADEWILNNLVNYTKDLRILLSDADVQGDWRFARLRYHYCGLIEELYENVNRTPNPTRWMPFESRKSAFTLMEEWCGYLSETGMAPRREEEFRDKYLTAAMEKEKSNLRIAALSAMAALCAGPISMVTESSTVLQFNLQRMLSWIDSVFVMPNDRMQLIGQKSLRLLILHNPTVPHIVEHAIQCCYGAKGTRALESCFTVLSDVLIQQPEFPISLIKVLGAVIFTLGHENRDIRIKSARLLRILDERQQKSSNLQEFDISISDKTRAVYKMAQFEYSRRLARAHPDLAFLIFSEFCLQFRKVAADIQRTMVAAVLPWLQTLELQVEPGTGGPTALSHMLLANMIEITVRFGNVLHNEVQALWQALATGPYAGNVQLVMDFIINLSLERREQNFVEYAKQIVVHLSATLAGSRVLDFLLLQLVPKNMTNEKKHPEQSPPDVSALPYVADLMTVLPTGHKQASLSLGQVSLMFLVDLLVPPVILKKEDVLKLMHAVFILWDHYTQSVQEQAREMLVHLIHSLVNGKVDEAALEPKKQLIEELVEAVRKNENQVTWSYEDHAGKTDYSTSGDRLPTAMAYLAEQIVDVFSLGYEDFSDSWAKEALHWASICPVRHLACRSFQVFRCVSVQVDSSMLADMLARLSNTVADEQADYQTFSLEILTTLRVIISTLDVRSLLKHPQLFWTTVACMDTIHEREFFESLGMLERFAIQLDLSDQQVIDTLLKAKPLAWEGDFEGLEPLAYKGLRSIDCLNRTLNVLQKLANIPDNELLGKPDRLLFNTLANLPRFLYHFDNVSKAADVQECAGNLGMVARLHGYEPLAKLLDLYSTQQLESEHVFLKDVLRAIQAAFFPAAEAQSLIFMMGLLTNQTVWFRIKILNILCELIPTVDMKNPAITSHGPDLISPLLRLLQTDLCTEALKVMDHIIEVTCTPMDRHHIRMSMTSGPARAIRKEYESTQSLYGIPEASGWSIPMPAIHSSQTRSNVHAVFYTCNDSETLNEQATSTPEVEFHQDDGYSDSYFPSQGHVDTRRSMETATDTNMGDLVSTLDSLDDFFDDVDATTPVAGPATTIRNFFDHDVEQNTHLYDQQTAPILSRSLNRTSSSLSFQNGLTESRPFIPHHRNQQSFSSNLTSNHSSFTSIEEVSGPGPSFPTVVRRGPPPVSTNFPPRPGLHSRSITSPANQFSASQPSTGFAPPLPTITSFGSPQLQSFYDDMGSDGENSPFPMLTPSISNPSSKSNTPISSQSNVTPNSATDAQGGFMRRGMRRLTGGKSDKVRMRTMSGGQQQHQQQYQPQQQFQGISAPGQSPRIPRIPLEYLGNPQTANNPAAGSSPLTPGSGQL